MLAVAMAKNQPQPPAISTGIPLPNPFRSNMEGQMGYDFSDVRVHHDHSPTLIGALAYTQGSDIFIAPGLYSPNTPAGQQLLCHELTHVVQQRGPSETPVAQNLVEVPDDGPSE